MQSSDCSNSKKTSEIFVTRYTKRYSTYNYMHKRCGLHVLCREAAFVSLRRSCEQNMLFPVALSARTSI